MQDQIDQINDRLDQNDEDQQDFSDSVNDSFADVQNKIDEHDSSISDLQQQSGQLTFPLSQDSIDLISEAVGNMMIWGTAVMPTTGSVTVNDNRITTNSIVIVSSQEGFNPPHSIFGYVSSAGVATIKDVQGSGTAYNVNYLIIFNN